MPTDACIYSTSAGCGVLRAEAGDVACSVLRLGSLSPIQANRHAAQRRTTIGAELSCEFRADGRPPISNVVPAFLMSVSPTRTTF